MSVAGGVHTAFARAERVDATALQIFVKNANRWEGKPIPPEDARAFADERERTGIRPVVAHASYLINLASPDDALWRRSIGALVDELERCESLALDGLVLHPGSHVGEGEERGLRRVARGLGEAFRGTRGYRCRVLLETTAGQGTNLGSRFEHLAVIRGRLREPERAGTCLDTCHVFAAGYDLRTPADVRATLDRFQEVCGLDTLGAVHLNDSLKPFESRRDRHAHIGEGEIGRAGFAAFLRDRRLRPVPMLLETPKGERLREDRRNLELVRELAAGGDPARRRALPTDDWRRGTLRGQRAIARARAREKRAQSESASSSS
ncbi:MAG TPA: deoxyribonuclease IV [bacterium]|nr:deoxyribonuclease IV [bacterium]